LAAGTAVVEKLAHGVIQPAGLKRKRAIHGKHRNKFTKRRCRSEIHGGRSGNLPVPHLGCSIFTNYAGYSYTLGNMHRYAMDLQSHNQRWKTIPVQRNRGRVIWAFHYMVAIIFNHSGHLLVLGNQKHDQVDC
jgi:hypothetical protein